MKKILILILLSVVIFSFSINTGSSAWNYLDGYVGDFIDPTMPTLSNSGIAQFGKGNYTYAGLNSIDTVGNGYEFNFTFNVEGNKSQWFWWNAVYRFQWKWKIYGSNDTDIWLNWYSAQEVGILYNTSETLVGTTNVNLDRPIGTEYPQSAYRDVSVTVQVYYLNSTTIQCLYMIPFKEGNTTFGHQGNYQLTVDLTGNYKVYRENFTVPSGWSSTGITAFYFSHDGSGFFDVNFTAIEKKTSLTPIVDNIPDWENLTRNWINDVLDFLLGAGAFFLDLVKTLGNVILTIAPFLPLILLFYIVDVGFTSMQEGSFQPIGNAFMKFYEFVLLVYDRMISLGMLIWDAITFWN